MTTTVTIKTVVEGSEPTTVITVGDVAQAKVLRTFNVTNDEKVDATKVLCAALIQQMLDLQAANPGPNAKSRTATMAITDLEKVQMLCVKANFAQA